MNSDGPEQKQGANALQAATQRIPGRKIGDAAQPRSGCATMSGREIRQPGAHRPCQFRVFACAAGRTALSLFLTATYGSNSSAQKKMWTAGTTHGNAGLKADSNALVLPKIARKVSLFACRKRISDAKIREHVSVYLLLRRPAHLALCRKLHGRYHSKPCSEMSSQLYNASWTNTKKHTLRRETVSRPENMIWDLYYLSVCCMAPRPRTLVSNWSLDPG